MLQKPGGGRAVHDVVVERHREAKVFAECEPVAVFHRFFADPAHGHQDRGAAVRDEPHWIAGVHAHGGDRNLAVAPGHADMGVCAADKPPEQAGGNELKPARAGEAAQASTLALLGFPDLPVDLPEPLRLSRLDRQGFGHLFSPDGPFHQHIHRHVVQDHQPLSLDEGVELRVVLQHMSQGRDDQRGQGRFFSGPFEMALHHAAGFGDVDLGESVDGIGFARDGSRRDHSLAVEAERNGMITSVAGCHGVTLLP